MRLIRFWTWLLPIIIATTVIVNVYLLSYLHSTTFSRFCDNSITELVDNRVNVVAFPSDSAKRSYHSNVDESNLAVVGTKRSTKGFLTIGLSSIHRVNGPEYLLETLASLSEHTTAAEKAEVSVVVLLADFDAEYNNESAAAILKQHRDDVASGFISIVQVSSGYYPQLTKLKRNFGDAPDRVQWRAKQVADFSLLFTYAINISEYYIQLEDDVHSALGYIRSIRHYIADQNRLHPDWAVLEFSELGFIGKLFRSSDLQRLAEFMMMFYVEQPVDWLFRYFKFAINQQQTYLRKPTVFQHFGVRSSFDASKDNTLKDRFFDPGDGPLSNADNPPATVFSTMPHYQDFLPDMAYSSGTGYFWATEADVGDSLQVIFDVAQNLSRVVVRTGHADYPNDIMHIGQVFVGSSVTKVKEGIASCDSTKSVASFHNGIAIAEHLETVLSFRVRCLKVNVEVKHDHWVVFANVAVFLAM